MDVAYLYAVIWFLTGMILIIHMGKENRVFYLLGGFFLFLGVWWAVGAVTGVNLFAGVWGVILRVVTAGALVAACVAFSRQVGRDRAKHRGGDKK